MEKEERERVHNHKVGSLVLGVCDCFGEMSCLLRNRRWRSDLISCCFTSIVRLDKVELDRMREEFPELDASCEDYVENHKHFDTKSVVDLRNVTTRGGLGLDYDASLGVRSGSSRSSPKKKDPAINFERQNETAFAREVFEIGGDAIDFEKTMVADPSSPTGGAIGNSLEGGKFIPVLARPNDEDSKADALNEIQRMMQTLILKQVQLTATNRSFLAACFWRFADWRAHFLVRRLRKMKN